MGHGTGHGQGWKPASPASDQSQAHSFLTCLTTCIPLLQASYHLPLLHTSSLHTSYTYLPACLACLLCLFCLPVCAIVVPACSALSYALCLAMLSSHTCTLPLYLQPFSIACRACYMCLYLPSYALLFYVASLAASFM